MSENKRVTLVGHYGSDESIALAAWTSTSREINDEKRKRIPNLVEMLYRDGHKCYDSETEILTESGWKYFTKLTEQDKVFAVDINTREFQIEKPKEIVSFDYNEPLYYLKTQQLDLAVTKGHRMVVSSDKKSCSFKTVEEVENLGTVRYLKSAKNRQEDVLDENLAKLMGFFIGDGYSSSGKRVVFHIKKQRKINYILSLGFEIEKQKSNKYVLKDEEVCKFLASNFYTENGDKCLHKDFYLFSSNDINNILDGLRNSDGTTKRNTWVYHTTSKTLKDQLLTVAALNDFVFTESSIVQNGKKLYRLNYSSRVFPEVIQQPSRKSENQVSEWRMYNGKVHCVTVSTGAILVRRNGKICVSGNTPFERGVVHFLVETDIASHIHIIKHRLVGTNGESARYKQLTDKYYIPEDWKGIKKSEDTIFDYGEMSSKDWAETLEAYTKLGNDLYHRAFEDLKPVLGAVRAKESARYFRGYNSVITTDCIMNMSCFDNVYQLRHAGKTGHPQKEIHDIVGEMADLIEAIEGNPFETTMRLIRGN